MRDGRWGEREDVAEEKGGKMVKREGTWAVCRGAIGLRWWCCGGRIGGSGWRVESKDFLSNWQ